MIRDSNDLRFVQSWKGEGEGSKERRTRWEASEKRKGVRWKEEEKEEEGPSGRKGRRKSQENEEDGEERRGDVELASKVEKSEITSRRKVNGER